MDIDTLEEDEYNKLLSEVSYFSENSGWGTPTTLALKDKKAVANLSGYTDSTTDLDNFFKQAGLKD